MMLNPAAAQQNREKPGSKQNQSLPLTEKSIDALSQPDSDVIRTLSRSRLTTPMSDRYPPKQSLPEKTERRLNKELLKKLMDSYRVALEQRDFNHASRLLSQASFDYFTFIRVAALMSHRGLLEYADIGAIGDILMLRGCLLGQYRPEITPPQQIEELYLCGVLQPALAGMQIKRFEKIDKDIQIIVNQGGQAARIPTNLIHIAFENGRWVLDISGLYRSRTREVVASAREAGITTNSTTDPLYNFVHGLVVDVWRKRGRENLTELWTPITLRPSGR